MSMTYEHFLECAMDIKNHSDSIDDDWNLCEHKNPATGSTIKYLVKKKIQKVKKSSLNSNHSALQTEDDSISIMCEYHVLYNPSYSCPDIYFNMWYTDGKLLSLELIWSVVHSLFKENLVRDKWNAITQEEHPIHNMPFFRVHPCQNTHMLKTLGFARNTSEFNPLITWLSTISPFIGLELHLSYGQ